MGKKPAGYFLLEAHKISGHHDNWDPERYCAVGKRIKCLRCGGPASVREFQARCDGYRVDIEPGWDPGRRIVDARRLSNRPRSWSDFWRKPEHCYGKCKRRVEREVDHLRSRKHPGRADRIKPACNPWVPGANGACHHDHPERRFRLKSRRHGDRAECWRRRNFHSHRQRQLLENRRSRLSGLSRHGRPRCR